MRNNLNRKMVVGVLAFFLAISVGYAIFSETITIEGTATASQGEFNLTTTCVTGIGVDVEDWSDMSEIENGYKNDSCTVLDNKVIMSVELENPGAARWFTVETKNTTDIDVIVEIDDEGHVMYNNAVTTLKVTDLSTNQLIEKNYVGIGQLEDDYGVEFPYFHPGASMIIDADGSYLLDYDEYMNKVYIDSNGQNYFKLAPGESFIIITTAVWSEDATYGSSSETKYTLPINYKQFTSDLQLNPDFEPCMFGC